MASKQIEKFYPSVTKKIFWKQTTVYSLWIQVIIKSLITGDLSVVFFSFLFHLFCINFLLLCKFMKAISNCAIFWLHKCCYLDFSLETKKKKKCIFDVLYFRISLLASFVKSSGLVSGPGKVGKKQCLYFTNLVCSPFSATPILQTYQLEGLSRTKNWAAIQTKYCEWC